MNTYDIETYEENGEVIPFCVCFILDNNEYYIYKKEKNIIIESLKLIVDSNHLNKIEMYIHNLNFDGVLILDAITKHNLEFYMSYVKTNIYYLDVFFMNKTIRFRCSYKIIPLSLRSLGEYELFKKSYFPYKFVNTKNLFYIGEIPEEKYWEKNDYQNYIKSTNVVEYNLKEEAIKYCMNDVRLTKKVLENIIPIIVKEGGGFIKNSFSSASLSHRIYYNKYNTKKIETKIKKIDENYIRSSYFGGRCEVFGNLKKNEYIKYYDFSGMYGQCMLEKFHNGEYKYTINESYLTPGFHTIKYRSNIDYLPVLPTKSLSNKLIFPNGEGIGTFWFEEIILFVEKGGMVIEVINSLVYSKYEEVFTDFVKNFTSIREKGGYYKVFGKLMINSLYGGMALNTTNEHTYITSSEEEYYNILEKTNVVRSYSLNSVYMLNIQEDYKSKKYFKTNTNKNEMSKRNVSYSAAISSKARIKLYKAMEKVRKDGGRLLYCDTDSIFAAYNINDRREHCGDFKWIDFYDDGVFIAPKTYGIKSDKEDIKIKGIHVVNEDFDLIKDRFYNNEDINFDNQLLFKKMNFKLTQLTVSKHVSFVNYDKRTFVDEKTDTTPLHFPPI